MKLEKSLHSTICLTRSRTFISVGLARQTEHVEQRTVRKSWCVINISLPIAITHYGWDKKTNLSFYFVDHISGLI